MAWHVKYTIRFEQFIAEVGFVNDRIYHGVSDRATPPFALQCHRDASNTQRVRRNPGALALQFAIILPTISGPCTQGPEVGFEVR